MKILSIKAQRNYDNPHATPDGHWVELTFENDYGVHTLEMNGRRLLPEDPALRRDLEWLLWDYGLLSQQDSRTQRQRVRVAQEQFDRDLLNYQLARAYMARLGAPEH